MTSFLKRFALAAAVFAAHASIVGAASAQSSAGVRRKARAGSVAWRVPTYKGIELGRSTRADVRRVFGKPDWSGHPEDEYDNPVPSLVRDEFENVAGFRGRVAVDMRRRDKVVNLIELRPPHDAMPTFEEFQAEFGGGEYVERPSDLGPCPTRAELRAFRPFPERDRRGFRVYPRKGFFGGVEEGRVREIVFRMSCP